MTNIMDYEDLICDIKDEAFLDCADEFVSALMKANVGDLTETFRNSVCERLDKLRDYNIEADDDEQTPVDDIERVLGRCKQKFSEVIDYVVEEALSAAEKAFRDKLEGDVTRKFQRIINEELYDEAGE